MRLTRLTVLALAVALFAAPIGAEAQPARRAHRVGILIPGAPAPSDRATVSFQVPAALRDLGYVEGQNLVIERRYAGGSRDRLSGLARELVQLPVDVIVAISNEAIQAARQATKTIPIVMLGGSVVEQGFVVSLAQPGGNVTGVAISETTLAAKRLELLKEAVPSVTRIAVLARGNTTSLRCERRRRPRRPWGLRWSSSRFGAPTMEAHSPGSSPSTPRHSLCSPAHFSIAIAPGLSSSQASTDSRRSTSGVSTLKRGA